jgi:hypothetical protein
VTDGEKTGGPSRFRAFALSLPEAVEGSHMGAADFRVDGRIFATLAYGTKGLGTLKLSLEQQADLLAEGSDYFQPAPGGWGRMGMTLVALDAPDDVVCDALRMAHRHVVESKAKKKPARPKKQTAS